MLAPFNWLKEYVDIDINLHEYADKMIMSGSMVESIEELGKEIDRVVVGKVVKQEKHPDADNLTVNQVDVGAEVVQIVTGAQNVKEGDYIPVALVGASLPGGIKIRKEKLRGIESQGMMCSAQELSMALEGLSEDMLNGIYILDQEYPLGTDIRDVLGLDDAIVEFEITNNRPDCLCVLGLARESAATLHKELKMPPLTFTNDTSEKIEDYIRVEVINPEFCPRYTCKVIKNVKIGPSPAWMQERLQKCGVRAINNMVDITNYIMLELGQPIHAFDYRMIDDKKIIVRTAKPQEEIVTLDGKTRALPENAMLITDPNKAIGIAGIMGALNSEIEEDTTTVVMEFACFHGVNTRLTSKALGLRTEASSRFEKQLDTELTMLALQRACHLVEQLGVGDLVDGTIDVYPNPKQRRTISLRRKKMNDFVGMEFSAADIRKYLESVGFQCDEKDDELIEVTVPSYRDDAEGEADLAEEVTRLYGYDILPSRMMDTEFVAGGKTDRQKLMDQAKRIMSAQGYYETCMYSFVSPGVFDKINLSPENPRRKAAKLVNPLGEEQSIMRTTMMPNMMDVISKNDSHKVMDGRFFEISKLYLPNQVPITELVNEQETLIMGAYGKDEDLFTLKGAIEGLLAAMKITDYEIIQGKNETFHPGRTGVLKVKGVEAGVFGEVHPMVAKNYGLDIRVYLAEINFDLLRDHAIIYNQYVPLPKYPAVERDIALVVPEETTCKQIEDLIRETGGKIVESVELFDIYRGLQIKKEHKSMAYGIKYRSAEKTLNEADIQNVHGKILNALEEQLGASLRK